MKGIEKKEEDEKLLPKAGISPVFILYIPHLILRQRTHKSSLKHGGDPPEAQPSQYCPQDEENLHIPVLLGASHDRTGSCVYFFPWCRKNIRSEGRKKAPIV